MRLWAESKRDNNIIETFFLLSTPFCRAGVSTSAGETRASELTFFLLQFETPVKFIWKRFDYSKPDLETCVCMSVYVCVRVHTTRWSVSTFQSCLTAETTVLQYKFSTSTEMAQRKTESVC